MAFSCEPIFHKSNHFLCTCLFSFFDRNISCLLWTHRQFTSIKFVLGFVPLLHDGRGALHFPQPTRFNSQVNSLMLHLHYLPLSLSCLTPPLALSIRAPLCWVCDQALPWQHKRDPPSQVVLIFISFACLQSDQSHLTLTATGAKLAWPCLLLLLPSTSFTLYHTNSLTSIALSHPCKISNYIFSKGCGCN